MDRNKINDRFLNCIGFKEHTNKFTGKSCWAWGMYTEDTDKMCKNLNLPYGPNNQLRAKGKIVNIPIIEYDDSTQMAYASPINFSKKITTVHGMDQFINNVSFLMSTES